MCRAVSDYSVKIANVISNRYKIPIIMASSISRHNYYTQISMESFKESGGIEYGVNLAIGMQVKGLTNDETKNKICIDRCKKQHDIPIELIVLKNRYGESQKAIEYSFVKKFGIFIEL